MRKLKAINYLLGYIAVLMTLVAVQNVQLINSAETRNNIVDVRIDGQNLRGVTNTIPVRTTN